MQILCENQRISLPGCRCGWALSTVAERTVSKDPGKYQPQGQRQNDQQRGSQPGGGITQRHFSQIIYGTVEIQPRHHDHDRRYGNGDPGISKRFLDQRGQKPGRQSAQKSSYGRRQDRRSTSSSRSVLAIIPIQQRRPPEVSGC